jgi:copper(I)-binding protein
MSPSRLLRILPNLVLAVALCSPVIALAEILIEDAWARATPPGARTGAIYLTLSNDGAADSLVGAATEAADRAELHTHVHENGMMAMREVETIALPAGGVTRLEPHGDHVMLFGLRGPLVAGESISLTLEFHAHEPMKLDIPVRDGRSQ